MGRVGLVTGEKLEIDAEMFERLDGGGCGGTDGIGHEKNSREPTFDGKIYGNRRWDLGCGSKRSYSWRNLHAVLLKEREVSQQQSFPIGGFAGDALARGVLDVGDFFQRQIFGLGGFDDGFGQGVKTGGREGGTQGDGRCFGNSLGRGDVGDGRVALGEGSGLVDDEKFDLGEFFERGGISDENAEAGGPGESAGGGHGGGETEGAGAGGDENRDGPIDGGAGCFSGENPTDGGGQGKQEDEGSEDAGDFVSQALEGRGIFAGFLDESGESGN